VAELYEGGNGVRLQFAGQANLHTSFRPGFRGSISSRGTMELGLSAPMDASLLGFGFKSINLEFYRRLSPNFALITGSAVLNPFPGNLINASPTFEMEFTHNSSTGKSTGYIGANLTDASLFGDLKFFGYDIAPSLALNVSGELGTLPAMQWSNLNFENNVLLLPALSGTLTSTGSFNLGTLAPRAISLRGFTAPSSTTTITFNNTLGLHVSGTFDLKVQPPGLPQGDFGDVSLAGGIAPNGTYSLAGSGLLRFGSYSTDPFSLRLSSAGNAITPAGTIPSLNFGTLDVEVRELSINSSAIAYSMSKKIDKSMEHLHAAGVPHLRSDFEADIGFAYDFRSGALSAAMTADARWTWTVLNFVPPPGFRASDSFSISGVITDNGRFKVDDASAGGNGFFAPYWWGSNNPLVFLPPPTWPFGSLPEQSYTLW
jgi:hypothetical protein